MKDFVKVAVLGSTGYVGLELVKLLGKHPFVKINFLGCENSKNLDINQFHPDLKNLELPKLDLNQNFNPNDFDYVFLCLPHGVSHEYVKKLYNKIKIIDLSADFRLDSKEIYSTNYSENHSCFELLDKFIYGLPEIYKEKIKISNQIAIPGCYPTSILLPLIPLLKNNVLDTKNIIIDSKSGYSGAGKKFDLNNINNKIDYNFYNYNTNDHRHICEINQELQKFSKNDINFSFNPHILPVYRGMMSSIYCDLLDGFYLEDIKDILKKFSKNLPFIHLLSDNEKADFYQIQNTNNCLIKLFKHHDNSKVIIVSLIDNLLKGAAGQAMQCFNIRSNFDEKLSLI